MPGRAGVGSRRARSAPAVAPTRTAAFLLLVLAGSLFAPATSSADDHDEPADSRSILTKSAGSPEFSAHGFADIMISGSRVRPDDGPEDGATAFALGELDFYIVSHLPERTSFLGEVVIEIEDDGTTVVDVERLFVKYAVSDSLWISLGRRHTPLGYWNETFHHGLLLQPTVSRPEALRFEDGGGVLPVHTIGIQAGGRRFSGPWTLEYTGVLGNGRGPDRTDVQSTTDANDSKAFSVKFSAARDGPTSRLRFGTIVYHDQIPPNPDVAERAGEIREWIYGAHFAYQNRRIELLSEYHFINHLDRGTDIEFTHPSFYAILIWRPWRWKPYVGFDRLDLDTQDPYFSDLPPDLERVLAGVRFDITPFNALKFEFRHDDRPGLVIDELDVQVAFTF